MFSGRPHQWGSKCMPLHPAFYIDSGTTQVFMHTWQALYRQSRLLPGQGGPAGLPRQLERAVSGLGGPQKTLHCCPVCWHHPLPWTNALISSGTFVLIALSLSQAGQIHHPSCFGTVRMFPVSISFPTPPSPTSPGITLVFSNRRKRFVGK